MKTSSRQLITRLLALDPYGMAVAAARAVASGLQQLIRVERTILRGSAAREGGLGVAPASVPAVGFAGRTVRRDVLVLRISVVDVDNHRNRWKDRVVDLELRHLGVGQTLVEDLDRLDMQPGVLTAANATDGTAVVEEHHDIERRRHDAARGRPLTVRQPFSLAAAVEVGRGVLVRTRADRE